MMPQLRKGSGFVLCWALMFIIERRAQAGLAPDGSCPLYIYVPMQTQGSISHLTAALIAIDDFNNRNIEAVPELAEILDCPVSFPDPTTIENTDEDSLFELALAQRSKVLDSGTFTSQAAADFRNQLPEIPCIAVGPFDDVPAIALSGIATTFEFPLVIAGALDLYAAEDDVAANSIQVYPDIIANAKVLTLALQHFGRTTFVANIYPLSPLGAQVREVLGIHMRHFDMVHRHFGMFPRDSAPPGNTDSSVVELLQEVKASGYRTIVLTLQNPAVELPAFAKAANEAGLTNGDYTWWFFGKLEPEFLFDDDPEISKFLGGTMWSTPLAQWVFGDDEPLTQGWLRIDDAFVGRIQTSYSVDAPGGSYVEDLTLDFYNEPKMIEYGSGYMYDAVMTAGIGSCQAWKAAGEQVDFDVATHMQALRNVTFTGATGDVFYEDDSFRGAEGTLAGILNVVPQEQGGGSGLSSVLFEDEFLDHDLIVAPIFADGRSVPPDLLRDVPEQNYLGAAFRIIGFILIGMTIVLAVSAMAWTYVLRDHKVLRASQPELLQLLCLGSVVLVLAILPLSFDESYGLSARGLDIACMSVPWLFAGGYIITYGALFIKLWRINRLLQFARSKIDIKQVAWPFFILMMAGILVLTLWTALDPLVWDRKELDPDTGESIGRCTSGNMVAYLVPIVFVMLLPACLTMYMSWKTRDVDDSYSESKWITCMAVVQFEVILIALPMVGILREVSTNGRYIGLVLLIWMLPISTLGLIFGPKLHAVYSRKGKGGSRGPMTGGNVLISGLTDGTATRTNHVLPNLHSAPNCTTENLIANPGRRVSFSEAAQSATATSTTAADEPTAMGGERVVVSEMTDLSNGSLP